MKRSSDCQFLEDNNTSDVVLVNSAILFKIAIRGRFDYLVINDLINKYLLSSYSGHDTMKYSVIGAQII